MTVPLATGVQGSWGGPLGRLKGSRGSISLRPPLHPPFGTASLQWGPNLFGFVTRPCELSLYIF